MIAATIAMIAQHCPTSLLIQKANQQQLMKVKDFH
jgi:hypothetical protein